MASYENVEKHCDHISERTSVLCYWTQVWIYEDASFSGFPTDKRENHNNYSKINMILTSRKFSDMFTKSHSFS